MTEAEQEDREIRAEVVAELLAEVSDAAESLAGARQDVRDSEQELRRQIAAALSEKIAVTAIARASGLSRERIYQIRDGRR